jgi:hypothetical protein
MTATRYKVPKNFALERFGINLLDLFKEDEEGKSYEFNGFEGLAPQFKTSNLEKGRGGVLGYKVSPNAPKFSRTSVFSLAPEPLGGGGGAPTPVPPEEEPFEERFLTSFIDEMGDPSKGVIGAMGVGRALEHGYTKEDVIKKAALEGVGFGEQAAKSLGLSDLSQYQGSGATSGTIGLTALSGARRAGLSDELIKDLAKQQGLNFGEGAASQLGVPTDLSQYQGPGATSGTIGLTALSGARRAGLSDELIKDLAKQQGLNFGEGAASQLGIQQARPAATSGGGGGSASNLSGFINFAGGGNAGTLGLEAVNRARAQGISDAQIRQQAAAQGLGFGAAARSSLGL